MMIKLFFDYEDLFKKKDPDEVYIKEINIYETYHAGAVIRISLKDKLKDIWHVVWENPAGINHI